MPFKKGNIYTIGSITAEDEDFLEKLEKFGFIAIEMELSAIYNAARKAGISAASILFVSDLPLRVPIWEIPNMPEEKTKQAESKKKAVELAVEFITMGG